MKTIIETMPYSDTAQAGRGNRANGLITPDRSMTMESVAGKNPMPDLFRLLVILVFFVVHSPSGLADQMSGVNNIKLVIAGDTMLARGVSAAIRGNGVSWPWGDVLPLLREADLAVLNLECVIGRKGNEFMPRRVFYFRADDKAADALAYAGIDLVSIANNHAMDFRAEGLMETRRLLKQKHIAFTGAGKDLQQAQEVEFIDIKGMHVAMIAFADHFREYAAKKSKPGINYLPVSTNISPVKKLIKHARQEGADLIIFSMHWGPNMNRTPLPGFTDFAHAVIDAGADIFHGHSAHIFQGIEFYKKGVILYDTGDLIDDYYVYPQYQNDQQLLFQVTASSNQVEKLELIPLKISNAQVNHATGIDYEEIFLRIKKLSLPFGTQVTDQGRKLIAQRSNIE